MSNNTTLFPVPSDQSALPATATNASTLIHYNGALLNVSSQYDPNVNPFRYGQFPLIRQYKIHMTSPMESCVFRSCFAGISGAGLGLIMGVVFSGFGNPFVDRADVVNMTFRDQMRYIWRDTRSRAVSLSKNFGGIGFLYSGIECVIEKERGKHDIYNTLAAGCTSGGVLAARAGPQAAAFGCVGFAAFSLAIEHVMHMND